LSFLLKGFNYRLDCGKFNVYDVDPKFVLQGIDSMSIIDVCSDILESLEDKLQSEFTISFDIFNEKVFGSYRDVSLVKYLTDNILLGSDEETKNTQNILQCLRDIDSGNIIEPELYRDAMKEVTKIREEHPILSYVIETTIASSLCEQLFNKVLNKQIHKEEIKNYKENLVDIQKKVQWNNKYCNTFIENINTLYERYGQQSMSKEAASSFLSIEFTAYFFKSLSMILANELNKSRKLGLENEDLLEICVELRKSFVLSCLLMLAINYLQAKLKVHCNDSTDQSIGRTEIYMQ